MENETSTETTLTQSPGWTAQLPDDLKTNEVLTRFKTIGDLGRAFLEADGRLSKSVPLLTDDATEEQRAEFFNKLGRPETPDEYELPEVDGIDQWRQRFHELGLTKSQAKALAEMYVSETKAMLEAKEAADAAALAQAQEALKQEWGEKYDANLELARRAVVMFGGDEFKAFLDETGLGNDVRLIKVFGAIGQRLVSEDTAVSGTEVTTMAADGIPRFPYES